MERRILRTAADFNEAFLRRLRVEVWDGDRLEDYGGPIELHERHAVRINSTYYVKRQYQFFVRPGG